MLGCRWSLYQVNRILGKRSVLLADIDVATLSSFRVDSSPSSLFPPPPLSLFFFVVHIFLIFQDLKVVAVSLVPSCESNSNSLILIIGMVRIFSTSLVGMTLHGQITNHQKITCPKLVRLIDYIDRYLVMNCQRHDRSWVAWDVMNVTLHGSSGKYLQRKCSCFKNCLMVVHSCWRRECILRPSHQAVCFSSPPLFFSLLCSLQLLFFLASTFELFSSEDELTLESVHCLNLRCRGRELFFFQILPRPLKNSFCTSVARNATAPDRQSPHGDAIFLACSTCAVWFINHGVCVSYQRGGSGLLNLRLCFFVIHCHNEKLLFWMTRDMKCVGRVVECVA